MIESNLKHLDTWEFNVWQVDRVMSELKEDIDVGSFQTVRNIALKIVSVTGQTNMGQYLNNMSTLRNLIGAIANTQENLHVVGDFLTANREQIMRLGQELGITDPMILKTTIAVLDYWTKAGLRPYKGVVKTMLGGVVDGGLFGEEEWRWIGKSFGS